MPSEFLLRRARGWRSEIARFVKRNAGGGPIVAHAGRRARDVHLIDILTILPRQRACN
jgi:hypothetical protein